MPISYNFSAALLADADKVICGLRRRGWRLAVAESITGGLIAAVLTELAGASDILSHGAVVYGEGAKTSLLGIPEPILANGGVYSGAVAMAMAESVAALGLSPLVSAPCQLGLGITGVAGPGDVQWDDGKTTPAGSVWIGLSQWGQAPQYQHYHFDGDRHAVRQQALGAAIAYLKSVL
jgi:nicotinamide-nucleotide amidase